MSASKQKARENLLKTMQTVVGVLSLLGFSYKTESSYFRHLWAASLQMFRDGDVSLFLDGFIDEIRNQLTRAFNQGAREVGVDPSEFTQDDKYHLEGWINSEYNYVLNLAQDIQDLRMTGVSLDQFRVQVRWRINLWANRYREVVNEARVYFGGKTRMIWKLGPTEEHCPSCSFLAGTVAFADEWEQAGVKPQRPPNSFLKCGGWGCLCEILPTNQRRSPKALEKLLDYATSHYV